MQLSNVSIWYWWIRRIRSKFDRLIDTFNVSISRSISTHRACCSWIFVRAGAELQRQYFDKFPLCPEPALYTGYLPTWYRSVRFPGSKTEWRYRGKLRFLALISFSLVYLPFFSCKGFGGLQEFRVLLCSSEIEGGNGSRRKSYTKKRGDPHRAQISERLWALYVYETPLATTYTDFFYRSFAVETTFIVVGENWFLGGSRSCIPFYPTANTETPQKPFTMT